jgi:hypothetical protein
MTEPAVLIIVVSGLGAAAFSIRTIANAVVRHREQDRKIAEASAASVSDERMARLETAVDAIAVEVERISEGQRFATRLLSEQSQGHAPGTQPARLDTTPRP